MTQHRTKLAFGSILGLLRKGYLTREIVFKGLSLKIFSKTLSYIRYRFYYRGVGVDIDYRSIVDGCRYISVGNSVWIQRGAWLSVPLLDMERVENRPYLIIDDGTRIGPNCTISAANKVHIKKHVLFGPNVTVLDHTHEYRDITKPISAQGIHSGGEIVIEDNAWIAANAVIYSASRRVVIGRNSVVAANSVVRSDVAPFTIVSGNPATVIKKYNPASALWEPVRDSQGEEVQNGTLDLLLP